MKKVLILAVCTLFCALSFAQESGSTLNMLTLPTSARVTALGGENVSTADGHPSIALHNPALLANLDDNLLGLQFMTYADGATWMGAEFAKAFGDRHTGVVFGHYMGYGDMDETDAMGNVIGSFAPKDIMAGVGYSYLLSDRWSGGANFKLGYSHIAEYSSLAVAVDLGLNYLDFDNDFSASVVLRNLGAQVLTFDGAVEHMPYNLQAGVTKGLAHLPVQFSVTLTDLTRWKTSDYYVPDGEKLKFPRLALNHVVFGVEARPYQSFYLAVGYNFRRGYELKAAGSSHWAGLSAGAGFNVQKFKFGISWAKYHQSTSSIMGNVAYSF